MCEPVEELRRYKHPIQTNKDLPTVKRTSPAYMKALEAGWTIAELYLPRPDVSYDGDGTLRHANEIAFLCDFICVCGKREHLMIFKGYESQYIKGHQIDIAQILENNGSFSEEHLRMDGYDEAQIAQIRKPWKSMEMGARQTAR